VIVNLQTPWPHCDKLAIFAVCDYLGVELHYATAAPQNAHAAVVFMSQLIHASDANKFKDVVSALGWLTQRVPGGKIVNATEDYCVIFELPERRTRYQQTLLSDFLKDFPNVKFTATPNEFVFRVKHASIENTPANTNNVFFKRVWPLVAVCFGLLLLDYLTLTAHIST
jgi:hypothetical protein